MPVKDILIMHEKGMEALVAHAADAVRDVLSYFPQYQHLFQIKNMGNWMSENAHIYKNGEFLLKPYESVEWYLSRAKEAAEKEGRWSFNNKQLNASQIVADLSADKRRKNGWHILMTHHDLYGKNEKGQLLNFCFGLSRENAFSVVSTNRFVDKNNRLHLENFKTLVQHEFGHILGLTVPRRTNTYEQLGLHCLNNHCVMNQQMFGNLAEMTEARLTRKRAGLPPICPNCIEQGRKNLSTLYAHSVLNRPFSRD